MKAESKHPCLYPTKERILLLEKEEQRRALTNQKAQLFYC